MITNYRSMVIRVISPILNYFGFHINSEGIIQKNDSNIGITLSGKHLYVPKDGYDWFNVKDSSVLVPFNPFRIREHTLILSKFLCQKLSDHFRDEEDELRYNSEGNLLDIVTLVKRGPKNEDNLPANFTGVIYEIWCRNEDILGRGIDPEGNDIKAILMAMMDTISRYSNLIESNPDFNKIFKYIEKVEKQKNVEFEDAKSKYTSNLSQVDFSVDLMDNLDIVNDIDHEKLILSEDESEDDESEDGVNILKSKDDFWQYTESVYDDIEFE